MARPELLKVEHLVKRFPIRGGLLNREVGSVHAVEDVSFVVHEGETFSIVGESGCGKSTTGKCILRLIEPTSGSVQLDGSSFLDLKGDELTVERRKMTLIFQDPYSSLNPRMTVSDIIAEPLDIAGTYATREERDARVEQIMREVGLDLAFRNRYPHEFSGGQRQRIGIARAIVLEPKLVVCDEPVSALDVSVQAKVINLLQKLQRDRGLAYIFISHDLSVVKHISDTVMVMYLGHEMELAPKQELFGNPLHPYTKALLGVIPRIRTERVQDKKILEGDVPSPTNPPEGCCFHTRCPFATERCKSENPTRHEVTPDHFCVCHLYK